MTDQKGSLCYLIQETKESPVYLCVMDEAFGFHKFPLSVATCSRLSHECSGVVEAAISGYSQKHAFAEVAKVLSERFTEQDREG